MFTRLTVRNLAFAAVLALCLGFGIKTAHRLATAAGQAGEAASSEAAADETVLEPFPIPDGDSAQLLGFIQELLGEKKQFQSQEEKREFILRLLATQLQVAEKILKDQDLSDDDAEQAALLKLQGNVNRVMSGVPKSREQALKAINELGKDPRAIVQQFAQNNRQIVYVLCAGILPPKSRDALIAEILAELQKRKFAQRVLDRALMLGEALEEADDRERLASFYAKLIEGMTATENEGLIGQAKRLEGRHRRFQLPGTFLELEGTTLAGEKFDWDSYRGKVVLVDFWATWCGPCREELPNIKQAYKKYQKQGFEVVGISLDDNQAQLEEFLIDEKIRWVNLFEQDPSLRGMESPLAVKYGVTGIPMAILVDKKGNVVSVEARGEELMRLLNELLGKKE